MKYLYIIANIANWVIITLCLYAVGCCGFHILPAWASSENYKDINATLLSIALSYIAGYVIYLFTSVLPKEQREREVFELWEPHLMALYNEMSERIEEIRAYTGIPEDRMAVLKEVDAEPLKRYTALKPAVYIDKTVDRGESQPLRVTDEFSIKKNLNRHYDAVNKHLATMMNNPMAVDADKKLLDMLSQIKTARFLEQCKGVIDVTVLGGNANIGTPEMAKAYVEYVGLRDQLKKWHFPQFKYSMRMLTDEEVVEMHKRSTEQLAKMGTNAQELREFGRKFVKATRKE